MYKSIVLILLVIAVGAVAANVRTSSIQRAVSPFNHGTKALDWCPQCINSFDDLIEVVLDIILQYGIMDSCGHLCQLVTDKTGSGILGFICSMGCDFLGLDEFVKLMNKADIDPIYYCEEIKLCPVNDNGDAKFKSFVILPPRALTGSTISVDMVIVSTNGTGTGEIVISINTVDKIPLSTGLLLEAQKPGTFGERITIDTSPNPDCDPTTSQCELWLEGTYNVTVFICNGQCGSHHPHTAVSNEVCFDLYPPCIELINILDERISQSRTLLCGTVADKTDSVVFGNLYYIVRDAVDIKEFVPKAARQGAGTGTINFNIVDPNYQSTGDILRLETKTSSTFPEKISIKTYALSNCDSSTRICDNWSIGIYNATAEVSNGICSSHHLHTAIYDV